MTSQLREIVPSAPRLMGSLRDIGYDLTTAIADVLDNSVDAGAERIDIELTHAGPASSVRITDDGVGMTERALDEAMRYGTRRGYTGDELGRFGLGLKTASLSQCRALTVASRTTRRGRIAVRRWDLDRVAATDSWTLERLTKRSAPPDAVQPLDRGPGTVVLWQKLDRVDAFSDPSSAWAAAALERDAEALREHLGIIFHRFLDGSASGPPLAVSVNGIEVEAWDPFSREEAETEELPAQALAYESRSGMDKAVQVRPFILPTRTQYSSAESHDRASGPKRWNRQQGLYIYRNDRMIQAGGWNRLRTMDEHSKLARVAIDLPDGAEDDWRLNVSKMAVGIPVDLRPELRTLIGSVVARAQDRYRAGESAVVGKRQASDAETVQSTFRLGDHWTAIAAVLERELASDPERLDRILERLINSTEVRDGTASAVA